MKVFLTLIGLFVFWVFLVSKAKANRELSASITPQVLQKMEMEARQKWGRVTISGANILTEANK